MFSESFGHVKEQRRPESNMTCQTLLIVAVLAVSVAGLIVDEEQETASFPWSRMSRRASSSATKPSRRLADKRLTYGNVLVKALMGSSRLRLA